MYNPTALMNNVAFFLSQFLFSDKHQDINFDICRQINGTHIGNGFKIFLFFIIFRIIYI